MKILAKLAIGGASAVILPLGIVKIWMVYHDSSDQALKPKDISDVITAMGTLPDSTRVLNFNRIRRYVPGYLPSSSVNSLPQPTLTPETDDTLEWRQYYDEQFDPLSTPARVESITLLVSAKFKYIGKLTAEEYFQLLKAIVRHIKPGDSEEHIMAFTHANILLCGIMANEKSQNSCSAAIDKSYRDKGWWPCDDKDFVPTKYIERFHRFIVPTLTKRLNKEFRLGLLPSWYIDDNGNLHWYDFSPQRMNHDEIADLEDLKSCAPDSFRLKACDKEMVSIKRFSGRYWNIKVNICSPNEKFDFSDKEHLVLWEHTTNGEKNRFFSCHGGKRLKTIW